MSIDALIMAAGAFVAVLPFLGFPNSWDSVFFFIAGVVIIGLGVIVRRRLTHKATERDVQHMPKPATKESVSTEDTGMSDTHMTQ